MRDYAVVSPQFWVGDTGRRIRAAGPAAQVVALYLVTGPQSNMVGLYYLPIPTLSHETGIPIEGATKALRHLGEVGFAHYDEVHEVVWVPEMARYQVGPELRPKDKRVPAVVREVSPHRKCRFYKAFLDRYAKAFCLADAPSPEGPQGEPGRGIEGAWKDPRCQEQDHDQEQDQEQEQLARARARQPAAEAPAREPAADQLAEFVRLLCDALAITGRLKLADARLAASMRADVDRLGGAEDAANVCADEYRERGSLPRSLDHVAKVLTDLEPPEPEPPRRKPGELPKKGDPDFNDPVAWGTELDAFMHRGSKEPPPGYKVPKFKRQLTLEEEEEQERQRAGANGAAKP